MSLSVESLGSVVDEWNNRLDLGTVERLRKQTHFDAKELRQWHRGNLGLKADLLKLMVRHQASTKTVQRDCSSWGNFRPSIGKPI